MAECEVELKSLLMKVKEENEKAGLKLNIQKIKIMASGPITSWQIDGKTRETVTDFIFLGSKTTADGDWSHEIKKQVLLWRKAMRNLDSMLRSRHYITFLIKIRIIKTMVFAVVMYRCENWTIKKAECQRIDALNCGVGEDPCKSLDCNEIQPVSPKGNQPWLFIWRTGAEAETPILWPPDGKIWLTGKDPYAGKDWRQEEKGNDRGWDGWMVSPTRWTWVWVSSRSWWWTGKPGVLSPRGCKESDTT